MQPLKVLFYGGGLVLGVRSTIFFGQSEVVVDDCGDLRGELDRNDLFFVDFDALKDGLVEEASLFGVGHQIGGVDVGCQFNGLKNHFLGFPGIDIEGFEKSIGSASFLHDPGLFFSEQFVADLVLVAEFEQLSFFLFQSQNGPLDFGALLGGQLLDCLKLVADRVRDVFSGFCRECHLDVLGFDGSLNGFDPVVFLGAESVLAAFAAEVLVLTAVAFDFLEEESSAAFTAVDGAAQVVVVLPVSLSALPAAFKHDLDLLEGGFVDQRFVAALVGVAVVGQLAGVVLIFE